MAVLAASKEVIEQEGKLQSMPVVGTDIIYKGALCKINAAGFLAPCAAEAGSQFAGISYEEIDNSVGAAGAIECRVIKVGSFVLTIAGATQADVGSPVYATDDQLVTTTSATNAQLVGNISKYISATQVVVDIKPMSGVGA